MANSILKLRIDDQEYDAKLKKAVQGLQHLNEVAHKGAGEMTGLEKAEVQGLVREHDLTKPRWISSKLWVTWKRSHVQQQAGHGNWRVLSKN